MNQKEIGVLIMGLFTMETTKNQSCIDACNKCAQACYESVFKHA